MSIRRRKAIGSAAALGLVLAMIGSACAGGASQQRMTTAATDPAQRSLNALESLETEKVGRYCQRNYFWRPIRGNNATVTGTIDDAKRSCAESSVKQLAWANDDVARTIVHTCMLDAGWTIERARPGAAAGGGPVPAQGETNGQVDFTCVGGDAARQVGPSASAQKRSLRRYQEAARMLDREFFPTGRNSEFCWARAHATCDGETPTDSPALEVLHACVVDLAAYGDRPAPLQAYDNLDKCMNRAGWFRYEWYEITIN